MACEEGQQVPESLLDPITCEVFTDPVVASDGHTYERSIILDCWRECRRRGQPWTSPMTREPMQDTLHDNVIVRQLIAELSTRKRAVSAPAAVSSTPQSLAASAATVPEILGEVVSLNA